MDYFKYKQFDKDAIIVVVGYCLRYVLSYRDISGILRERGLGARHSTIYRWVQEYAPIFYQLWKRKHKKTYYKRRTDETYIETKGQWYYLYRAVDADRHTSDIWLRKRRGYQSAYAFIKRLIRQFDRPQTIVINQTPSTKVAMAEIVKVSRLKPNYYRTSKYLNNLAKQGRRHIKVRKTGYRDANTTENTLKGIEYVCGLYKKNRRSPRTYGFSPYHEISYMLAGQVETDTVE